MDNEPQNPEVEDKRLSSPSTETVGERTPSEREGAEFQDSPLGKRKPEPWEDLQGDKGKKDDLRICLQGIREFTKDYEIVKDLDKIFPDEDLGIEAIIKEPKRSFFFLRFKDAESKARFMIRGQFNLRNRPVKMKTASVSKGSLKKERLIKDVRSFIEKRAEDGKSRVAQQQQARGAVTEEEITSLLKDRICSFGCKPYEEQLKLKRERLHGYLEEIKTMAKMRLHEQEVASMGWLSNHSKQCCPLKDFLPCDESDQFFYRSKSEFTIGHSAVDGLIKIGFNVTDATKTFHSVELPDSPDDVMIVPEESFALAKIAEKIVRELTWPVYDRTKNIGFWRFMVVKLSKRTMEAAVNFVGNKKYFSDQDFLSVFKTEFVQKYVEMLEKDERLQELKKLSITFQDSATSSDCVPYVEDDSLELVHGTSKTYHERLADCMFEVSNSSFVQVNAAQSEKMYAYAGQMAALDSNTILLDICAGVGTIGIAVGKACKKVVGIEMVKSACANATKNARMNSMEETYEVVEGKVEERLEEVAAAYSAQGLRIVRIVDPPRAGLHPDVVRCLRTCKGLDLLVFICCDLKQSKTNIVDLCLPQSKKRRGPPFSPILCAGVDMFPQTPHFEALFVLQRLYEDLDK